MVLRTQGPVARSPPALTPRPEAVQVQRAPWPGPSVGPMHVEVQRAVGPVNCPPPVPAPHPVAARERRAVTVAVTGCEAASSRWAAWSTRWRDRKSDAARGTIRIGAPCC